MRKRAVAVDATGSRIILVRRDRFFGGVRPISPPPCFIELAGTMYGLGISGSDRIDVVRLGWKEESLI